MWLPFQTCQVARTERRHSAVAPAASRRRQGRTISPKHPIKNMLWRSTRSDLFRAVPVLLAVLLALLAPLVSVRRGSGRQQTALLLRDIRVLWRGNKKTVALEALPIQ